MCKTKQIMLKMCKRGEGRNTNDFCDSRLREMNKQVFDRIYIFHSEPPYYSQINLISNSWGVI